MGTRDPRFDVYIGKSAEFAQPILAHIREVVHAACPDVEETIKWGFPNFSYSGGILCSMASFKAHISFGFWLAREVLGDEMSDEAMGQFGRVSSIKELPSKAVLTRYIKKAMKLNEAGVKASRPAAKKGAKQAAIAVPPELAKALARQPKIKAQFDAMSPSHRREYCEWIADAKKPETRERRLLKAIEQIAEGKSQNWKYETRSS
jgi:hypothetical protein